MTISDTMSRTWETIGTSRTSSRSRSTAGPVITRRTSTSRGRVVRSMIAFSSSIAAARVLDDDVGPGDVGGHQVGRELDPRERELESFGERADEEGLTEAGCSLEQDVTAREEPDEHAQDDVVVADDDLLHLGAQG